MYLSDQDEGTVSVSIEHGLDAMLTEDGQAYEFHYNFLDYTFNEDEQVLWARHYMDRPGEISLVSDVMPPFESPFMRKVLLYLGLRYDKIEYRGTADDKGYVPLPAAVAEDLKQSIRIAMTAK